MLKIVTDGGADMPETWQDGYDIHILPLIIRFGERTYTQGIDMNREQFYDLISQTKIIPKTSLPSPYQIKEYYQKIASRGDEILSIHLGSKLSGTFAAVQLAAEELKNEIKIYPFDSGAGSAVLGFMCREARLLQSRGFSVIDIIKRLENIRDKLVVIFTLNTLEFAYLNGRISYLASTISAMLKIKPIVVLKDGLLQMSDKVRTRRRSIDRVIELVKERVNGTLVNVAVVHAADISTANMVLEKAVNTLNCKDLVITELSFPVAANLGPGAIGIVAYAVDQEG